MTTNIPISVVDLGTEEEDLVLEVLRSGRLAQGPKVEQFEQEFAAVHQVKHGVAVNSGTTALVATMQALNLQPGDEVITSPFSFVATLNAILEAGATARFADIGDDYCLDPDSVEALIGSKTRALMPVHLYGLPADMNRLSPLAAKHNLSIIEDAAQAHGARIGEKSVGSFGIGCFSMYATKNIMCGEGGIITTDDDAIADRLRVLRNQGMRERYQYEMAGHNYRMTDMQAAVAIPQLSRLSSIISRRQANAAVLTTELSGIEGLIVPSVPHTRHHVFHQYTVRVPRVAGRSRDQLQHSMEAAGISTGFYYPRLMHDYDCYRALPQVIIDDTPRASAAAEEVISIPVHQKLSSEQLHRIVDAVRSTFK